jgi:hypothetical protein
MRLYLGIAVGLVVGSLVTYDGRALRGQALQPAVKNRTGVDVAPNTPGDQPPPDYYAAAALRFQILQMDSRRPYLLDSATGQLWVLGQQEWVVYAKAPRAGGP